MVKTGAMSPLPVLARPARSHAMEMLRDLFLILLAKCHAQMERSRRLVARKSTVPKLHAAVWKTSTMSTIQDLLLLALLIPAHFPVRQEKCPLI